MQTGVSGDVNVGLFIPAFILKQRLKSILLDICIRNCLKKKSSKTQEKLIRSIVFDGMLIIY